MADYLLEVAIVLLEALQMVALPLVLLVQTEELRFELCLLPFEKAEVKQAVAPPNGVRCEQHERGDCEKQRNFVFCF